MTSIAFGTVLVISTTGMPASYTVSAAKRANSAAETRTLGMMPISVMRADTSFLFIMLIFSLTRSLSRTTLDCTRAYAAFKTKALISSRHTYRSRYDLGADGQIQLAG